MRPTATTAVHRQAAQFLQARSGLWIECRFSALTGLLQRPPVLAMRLHAAVLAHPPAPVLFLPYDHVDEFAGDYPWASTIGFFL
jgi:hypothetical protein